MDREVQMTEIVHRVGIKASPDHVFKALSTIQGLSGWWTATTTGAPEVGKTIHFEFRSPKGDVKGNIDMKVVAQEPLTRIQWECVKGPAEWIGTEIDFDLKQEDDYTIVLFGHRKWREWVEFTSHCSTKWGTFLMSLKELVETGTGRPAPRDVQISNWH